MRRLLAGLSESSARIAGAYLVFGAIWILVTDTIVRNIATSPDELTRIQTLKGWLFVFASAAVLFGLVHARERRLSSEQEFTDLALDSLRDIFVLLDVEGGIERVNEQAVEVTGYSESELLAMNAVEAFDFEDRDRVETAIEQAFEGNQSPVRGTMITKTGARIQYEFRGRRIIDGRGERRGLVVIGRDVTEQELNQQRLDVALRVLRHNLRNDLNVIRGWAESLGDDADLETVRAKITETVDHLLSMSEKARRMAELGDPSEAASREIDVVAQVRAIVDEFEVAHPDAIIERELTEDGGTIQSRGYQFETAVRNALENALDHNPAEAPWVRVAVRPSPEMTSVVIEDDGPGIPDNERLVFEEGYETPLMHGSGVGLWMVHWCLNDLGGSVRLRDRDPTGTEVTLELPPRAQAS